QTANHLRGDADAGDAVFALEVDAESAVVFVNVESGVVVDAGEDAAAGQDVEAGRAVAPGDIDAFAGCAVLIFPLDGDAVGGVFRAEAEESGQATWADVLEAD